MLHYTLQFTLAAVAPATRTFFAACPRGLEPVLARELSGAFVGGLNVEVAKNGVWFDGSCKTGMAAVLWSRTANRVMELLSSARAPPTRDSPTGWFTKELVYDFVRDSVEWPRLLSPDACDVSSLEDCTVACEATVGEVDRSLCNSHYTALELKNALVDDFRDRQGLRPSVDTQNPHLPLQLHVHQDTAWLFRTLSPFGSMHRRGYRQAMHVAVLRENLAAALVLETGLGHGEIAAAGGAPAEGSHVGFGGLERIDPDSTVLCDPMCGSATLAIEAALIATRTAPGLLRWGEVGEMLARRAQEAASGGSGYGARGSGAGSQSAPPPFWYWADYSRGEWAQLLREAEAAMRPLQMRIHLNDAHAGALALAKEAFGKLGYGGAGGKALSYSHADIGDYTPPEPPTLIPDSYGMSFPSDAVADTSELLGEGASDGDAASAWEGLGRFAKAAASAEAEGLQLWTLSGASDLTKHLRMRATKKLPISHGGVDLRWIRYDVLPPKREWLGADGRRAFDDNKAPARRIGR